MTAAAAEQMATTTLDRADIQGDVLRAYGNDYDRTTYVFVRVDNADRGRAWLRELLPEVTNDEDWTGPKPETHLNLAFTHGGLAALGLDQPLLDSFSKEFQQGMSARAGALGDGGRDDPGNWEPPFGDGPTHVLVTINALEGPMIDQRLAALRERLDEDPGLAISCEQEAGMLPGAREHFGYSDGFAQPAVEGTADAEVRARGGGVPLKDGGWRPLAPGEFILGYEDEDSRVDPQRRLPNAPADPLGRNGTYMVWRKLHQDVALFRRTILHAAELYEDGDVAKLYAKVCGRWQNGTPLAASPDAEDPSFDASAPGANDFRYLAEDAGGTRCPLGAHVRRSNPRDALGWDGLLSFRHRIIRRGMPYGDPLPEGAIEDDGADRGLVFVCFNASISRQFEAVQVQWLNDGNIFRLGRDSDYLMGASGATAKMTVQGDPPFFLAPQPSFVTLRGGEYLFVPGIAALHAIAAG
jgi:Dyp-type peroxidase family